LDTVDDKISEKKDIGHTNENESERATTPDQSPSTKAKLRKVCRVILFYIILIYTKILLAGFYV